MSSKTQCLVLGPEGVGKTLLIKTLKDGMSQVAKQRGGSGESGVIPKWSTQPTLGTNLIDCKLKSGSWVTLKECGGLMSSLWYSSLDDANMLIYVVDCSNNTQISIATILLMEILADKKMEGKPVLLFYNKTDVAAGCPLNLTEFKELMRINDLVKKYGDSMFTVVSGSGLMGENMQCIYEWLDRHN